MSEKIWKIYAQLYAAQGLVVCEKKTLCDLNISVLVCVLKLINLLLKENRRQQNN